MLFVLFQKVWINRALSLKSLAVFAYFQLQLLSHFYKLQDFLCISEGQGDWFFLTNHTDINEGTILTIELPCETALNQNEIDKMR